MHYIEEIREGARVNEIYLCKQKQTLKTKAGKPYDSVILQDKTGTLDAKIWEPGSAGIEDFDAMEYVSECYGRCDQFSGHSAVEHQASSQGRKRGG